MVVTLLGYLKCPQSHTKVKFPVDENYPIREAGRVMALLVQVLRDGGQKRFREQAAALGMPLSTAYRLTAQLQHAGLISRAGRGAFTIGFELQRLTVEINRARLLADIARPYIRMLAHRLKLTVHLGVIEDDMVTYVVKEHGGGPLLFTRSGTQLDAYCSAIGKMLLATLPEPELDRYLSSGPLIPLTSHTITEPDKLRRALQRVRVEDLAIDAEEVAENLRCVAVPVRDRRGIIVSAMSASRQLAPRRRSNDDRILSALRVCAARITAEL
jgi:IclR family transcriptional regulator, acetate operon repressor